MPPRTLPRTLLASTSVLALLLASCSVDTDSADEPVGSVESAASVGGCSCPTSGGCSSLSYSDIPADDTYYVTTFGGGADTQPMSCGGTADGTWAYVADSARFGCNTKLLIEANGKSCVAEVRDCGPNRCVEQAACSCSCGGHFPIIDASPFITDYLLGTTSVGWSEKKKVTAKVVDASIAIGCPGGPVPESDAGTGGVSGAGGTSGAAGTPASGGQAGAASGGTGAEAGAAGMAGSAGAAGGSGKKSGTTSLDGGCGCRLGGERTDAAGWLALLLGLFGARIRRRPRIVGRPLTSREKTR